MIDEKRENLDFAPDALPAAQPLLNLEGSEGSPTRLPDQPCLLESLPCGALRGFHSADRPSFRDHPLLAATRRDQHDFNGPVGLHAKRQDPILYGRFGPHPPDMIRSA